MEFELLINIFDTHNEASILLTEKYKPKNILFFYMNADEEHAIEKLKLYYNVKFPWCKFDYQKLDIDNPSSIEKVISSYQGLEGVCNLTSGKKLVTLMVYIYCIKHNINCRYVDIKNEVLIKIDLDGISIEKDSFVDLDIEDIIESIGGSIIVDSTKDYNDEAIFEFTMWIGQNLKVWDRLKFLLQDTNIFLRDENDLTRLTVDIEKIPIECRDDLKKRFKFLADKNQINLKEEGQYYKISFLNDFIKTFLFKSGTWLEILTQNIVEEIKEIDDVRSGLMFLWNNEKAKVRNELDVVAIKDSVIICISCKDSKKYDEVSLNELNVYASQLGGENVIKILVATKEPSKSTVEQRAKEMNIELVIFDGNIDSFKTKITKIINKKRETS
ncbi:MAG: Card1-like endonuclease domain-containing protein [Sarcina sp.]